MSVSALTRSFTQCVTVPIPNQSRHRLRSHLVDQAACGYRPMDWSVGVSRLLGCLFGRLGRQHSGVSQGCVRSSTAAIAPPMPTATKYEPRPTEIEAEVPTIHTENQRSVARAASGWVSVWFREWLEAGDRGWFVDCFVAESFAFCAVLCHSPTVTSARHAIPIVPHRVEAARV